MKEGKLKVALRYGAIAALVSAEVMFAVYGGGLVAGAFAGLCGLFLAGAGRDLCRELDETRKRAPKLHSDLVPTP